MCRNIMDLHALVLHAEFPANTPERAAFKAHLVNVACALREIEHTEDGEPKPDAENSTTLLASARNCSPISSSMAVRSHFLG